MTKITIFKDENLICGYQIKGHSGYAEEGSDIVCSGISTASQMALAGLEEVLGMDVTNEIRDGFMSVCLSEESAKDERAQALLRAMEVTLEDIAKNYARFVKMEVKKRCL